MRVTAIQKELVSVAAGLLALSISLTALASEVVTVVQKDREFSKQSVDIAVGDTIRFTNEDPYAHQLYVRSPKFSFSSEAQPKGMILPVPFSVAGSFEVRCEIHPKMLLTVNVK